MVQTGENYVEGIESLARMAARLSGYDPDEQLQMAISDGGFFDDLAWRHPAFLKRAEIAYIVLKNPGPMSEPDPPAGGSHRRVGSDG